MNRLETQELGSLNLRNRITGAVFAGSMLLAACGGGGNGEDAPRDGTSTTMAVEAPDVCAEGFTTDISFNNAFENAGSPEAVLPLLTKDGEGSDREFLANDKAAQTVMNEVCENPYALAALTAFIVEPAGHSESGRIYKPDTSSFTRTQELLEQYKSNPEVAAAAVDELASILLAPNGLEKVDDFVVTEGQATKVARTNGAGNGGFKSNKVTVDGALSGYEINHVTDSSDLSDEEKLVLEEISNLILITGDGEVIIKTWIGDSEISFKVDESPETTVLNPEEGETDQTTPQQQEADGQADSDGNRTGNRTTGTGGGGTSGSDGGGETTGGAPGGDGPGCDGVSTGCEGEGPGGPGGPGDGGEDEGPTPTNPPQTTTTTRPPQTTTTTSPPQTTTTTSPPPTTSPPTTAEPYKPPMEECDPNIDDC